jgi:hypothetical protein
MMDVISVAHMSISGLTSVAALYFKAAHGKLSERVAVLEERSKNDRDLIQNIDDTLEKIRDQK